jgi:nitrogenase molybdenum-iron protein alpha chain
VRKTPERRQEDLINAIVFCGSDVFTPMLAELGLRANNVVTIATVDEIARMSEAAASVTFCYSLGSYLAAALEQEYGVPGIESRPHSPTGSPGPMPGSSPSVARPAGKRKPGPTSRASTSGSVRGSKRCAGS